LFFNFGKVLLVVAFAGAMYSLASAGIDITYYLTVTAVCVAGMGIGGLLVLLGDRTV
jgi:hypothetical protein